MRQLLIPEWFGCGNKLGYFEAIALDGLHGSGEHRQASADGAKFCRDKRVYASSVDKIFQVALPEAAFCNLALRHAIADLSCLGAICDRVDVCFEFSNHSTVEERHQLSAALFAEAVALGLEVGKCHSTYGPANALILAVSGQVACDVPAGMQEALPEGDLIISGRLGGLGELYHSALTGDACRANSFVECVRKVDLRKTAAICSENRQCTDISGFGLWGSCDTLARRFDADLEIDVSRADCFAKAGQRVEASCLFAVIDESRVNPPLPPGCRPVALMRELCGPILFMVDAQSGPEVLRKLIEAGWTSPGIIGKFKARAGQGRVVCT